MPAYLSPGMYKIEYWNWEARQWQESGHWHLSDFTESEQDQLKRCQHVKFNNLEFRLVEETISPQRFEFLNFFRKGR